MKEYIVKKPFTREFVNTVSITFNTNQKWTYLGDCLSNGYAILERDGIMIYLPYDTLNEYFREKKKGL